MILPNPARAHRILEPCVHDGSIDVRRRLETLLTRGLDAVFAALPRAAPGETALARAGIVSHRGERDDPSVRENTLAAFDAAVAAGVAAIEFDVRFTRDDEPVVIHDADLQRVFDLPDRIVDTPWTTLHRRAPTLAHLDAVLARYRDRAHLMIELKTRGSTRAERRLDETLAPLTPVRDFHLLALDTALFDALPTLRPACRLPVAKLNQAALYRWALGHDCAGLAGSYALMRRAHIRRLRAAHGVVGTGFIETPALLARELARGVDWIFSNRAVRMQQALDALRTAPSAIA